MKMNDNYDEAREASKILCHFVSTLIQMMTDATC